MPQRVYNNIEGHRITDKVGGTKYTIEDVTKVGLPTFSHPTTELKNISGMAMDLDMPNTTHLEAADFTLYHNNGVNCQYLSTPGKHQFEVRVARQSFNTAKGEIEHKDVKYRITALFVSTQKGDIETGSPYGSTSKYSILRYEEVLEGKTTELVDAVAGTLKRNGVSYSDPVEKLLK